ncbi:MAG: hypothetical protein MUP14_06690 [Dehalococcoidia bacterium]|nr:hypothetical protein [Dehalococcoidia bacterium]
MGRRARQKRLKRGRRLRTLAAIVLVSVAAVALVVVALVGGLLFHNLSSGGGPPAEPRTAAIVDQVSLYEANPEFIAAATGLLQGAGYAVDYYPGEGVTVDLYRELPTHDYDLIVLRSHSARLRKVWRDELLDEVVVFTSEPYSPTRWYEDQKAQRLAEVRYYEGGDEYFGIRAEFVRAGMRGEFEGATIILMGCDGLQSQTTGQAFLDKGASAFISWDGPISWSHSDAATERLLELLLIEGLTTEDAVSQTEAELGPDPVFGAELRILTGGG